MGVQFPSSPFFIKLSLLDALVSIVTLVTPTFISVIIIVINFTIKIMLEKKENTMRTFKGVNCGVYVGNLCVSYYYKDRVLYRFAEEV